MSTLFTVLLHVIHFGYSTFLRIQELWRQWSALEPFPLHTVRQRIPSHLAILFVVDPVSDTETSTSLLTESVLHVVEWSRIIGVKKLTIYEENGLLSYCADEIRNSLFIKQSDCSESEEEYLPPTPPLSDYADSLSLSSSQTRKCSLKIPCLAAEKSHGNGNRSKERYSDAISLNLISRSASKPAIAAAAQALASKLVPHSRRNSHSQKVSDFELTVDQLNGILEQDERGLSAPDFMIIHHFNPSDRSTLHELHGFPPWQIRLTEIFKDSPRQLTRGCSPVLDEKTFRKALDEFASAEMRFGK